MDTHIHKHLCMLLCMNAQKLVKKEAMILKESQKGCMGRI